MLNLRWPDAWQGPYWEPHAIWYGISWTREVSEVATWEAWETLSISVCLIPCWPIRLMWVGRVASRAERMEQRLGRAQQQSPS